MNSDIFVIALLKCSGIGTTKALKFIVNNGFSIINCIKNIENIVSKVEFDFCVEQAKKEIKLNKDKNINIITIFNENFPSKLYTISDPVLYLYYFGDIGLLSKESIAIIGTRHPSIESINDTKVISKIISDKYVVVGGLALGIDKIGHETTIENGGRTIAVLPSSPDNIQPVINKELAKMIVKNGGLLVSEYSVDSSLSKFNYPKRDRIQAALSNVIVVSEAKEGSGTMITVNKALKEGKKVYQLKSNNNGKILNSISLSDNLLEILEKDVNNDLINQKNKIENLCVVELENCQTSLF